MRPTIHIWGNPGTFENYRRAILQAGGIPCISSATALLCDGLLLPGGGDMEPWRYGQENTASRGLEPARDAAELLLLDRYLTSRRPVLGICRGMQVLNVFFGGTLLQDLPGHSTIQGHDRCHLVRTLPSRLASVYGPVRIVNSAHHQAIDRPGSGLRIVQSAFDGVAEAVEHQQLPVWGVQWHPERLGAAGAELFRVFLEQCQ